MESDLASSEEHSWWSVAVADAMTAFAGRYALDGPEALPKVGEFLNGLPPPRDERESVVLRGLASQLRWRCAVARRRACALRAASYVRAHLADPLQINDLAQTVGSTPRTLRRSFREELRLTIRDFHTRARVSEALRLVAAGQKVSVAALATGYGGEEHLCRAVRRLAGIAPTAVRDLDPEALRSLLATVAGLAPR
jgi:AraC-like DNA-binding protein